MSSISKRELEEEYAETLTMAIALSDSRQELAEYVAALEDVLYEDTVALARRGVGLKPAPVRCIEWARERQHKAEVTIGYPTAEDAA